MTRSIVSSRSDIALCDKARRPIPANKLVEKIMVEHAWSAYQTRQAIRIAILEGKLVHLRNGVAPRLCLDFVAAKPRRRRIGKLIVPVLALLAVAPMATAEDVVRPPVAVKVSAGHIREWVGPPFPDGARNKGAYITYRGLSPEYGDDLGKPRECAYRAAMFTGSATNITSVWVDACGARPRVRILSALYGIRVSIHVAYDNPKPVFAPDPEPVADDVVLVCDVVPADQAPANALIANSGVRRAFLWRRR